MAVLLDNKMVVYITKKLENEYEFKEEILLGIAITALKGLFNIVEDEDTKGAQLEIEPIK